jgi:hypothetical protein
MTPTGTPILVFGQDGFEKDYVIIVVVNCWLLYNGVEHPREYSRLSHSSPFSHTISFEVRPLNSSPATANLDGPMHTVEEEKVARRRLMHRGRDGMHREGPEAFHLRDVWGWVMTLLEETKKQRTEANNAVFLIRYSQEARAGMIRGESGHRDPW